MWSGGELRGPLRGYGRSPNDETTYQNQFSIPTPNSGSSTGGVPALVNLCSAASFVSDGGCRVRLFQRSYGLHRRHRAEHERRVWNADPRGQYAFATADEGKPVIVTFTAQNLTGYSPDLSAPVYALTNSDFVDEKGNKDPVQVERADVFSLPTMPSASRC